MAHYGKTEEKKYDNPLEGRSAFIKESEQPRGLPCGCSLLLDRAENQGAPPFFATVIGSPARAVKQLYVQKLGSANKKYPSLFCF